MYSKKKIKYLCKTSITKMLFITQSAQNSDLRTLLQTIHPELRVHTGIVNHCRCWTWFCNAAAQPASDRWPCLQITGFGFHTSSFRNSQGQASATLSMMSMASKSRITNNKCYCCRRRRRARLQSNIVTTPPMHQFGILSNSANTPAIGGACLLFFFSLSQLVTILAIRGTSSPVGKAPIFRSEKRNDNQ